MGSLRAGSASKADTAGVGTAEGVWSEDGSDLRSLAEIETGRDAVPEGVEWYHCPLQREQIDAKDITDRRNGRLPAV